MSTITPEPDLEPHNERFPRDVHFSTVGEHTICTHVTEEIVPWTFEVVGETRNARLFAQHSAIVKGGEFQHVEWDDGLFMTYHPMAGWQEGYRPEEWLDEPVLLLDPL